MNPHFLAYIEKLAFNEALVRWLKTAAPIRSPLATMQRLFVEAKSGYKRFIPTPKKQVSLGEPAPWDPGGARAWERVREVLPGRHPISLSVPP